MAETTVIDDAETPGVLMRLYILSLGAQNGWRRWWLWFGNGGQSPWLLLRLVLGVIRRKRGELEQTVYDAQDARERECGRVIKLRSYRI